MGEKQTPPVTALPQLKNWHDIAYLDWHRLVQEQHQPLGRLRYVFSTDVQNSYTKDAIRRIVGEALDSETCHKYLWHEKRAFFPGDDAYRVLLASPNGRGAALILITHKAAFGQRRMIGKIDLWCAHSGGQVNLLFTVREKEEDDDDDWDDDGQPDDPNQPLFSVKLPRAAHTTAMGPQGYWILH